MTCPSELPKPRSASQCARDNSPTVRGVRTRVRIRLVLLGYGTNWWTVRSLLQWGWSGGAGSGVCKRSLTLQAQQTSAETNLFVSQTQILLSLGPSGVRTAGRATQSYFPTSIGPDMQHLSHLCSQHLSKQGSVSIIEFLKETLILNQMNPERKKLIQNKQGPQVPDVFRWSGLPVDRCGGPHQVLWVWDVQYFT